MFETYPELSHPLSKLYESTGCQYWTGMRLSFEAPWFVVSMVAGDGEDALPESWCVASDHQLLSWIQDLPKDRLLRVLCMLPNRHSGLRAWDSRPVASVWQSRHLTTGRSALVFRDLDGEYFTAWLGAEAVELYGDRSLAFELPMSVLA